MPSIPSVSVIIPTVAIAQRATMLRRAIDSVLAQEEVQANPIVVINGPQRDLEVSSQLRNDRRLRVTTLEQADLPAAILAGRQMVDTRFFTELDDDDFLLPGALATRCGALIEEPKFDAVVTNGIRRSNDQDVLHIPDINIVASDPLRALQNCNWCLPGCWLCQTDRVGEELFEGMPRFRECTYIAIRLAMEYRLKFLSCPTIVHHTDTPQSESKSCEYIIGTLPAQRRLLELDLPADVRTVIRAEISKCCRNIGSVRLHDGRYAAAIRWYVKSISQPGGFRYLLGSLKRVLRSPQ